MTEVINELVERFEEVRSNLRRLLESETEPSDGQIKIHDQYIDAIFQKIIETSLPDSSGKIDRIRFAAAELGKMCQDSKLAAQLCQLIVEDALSIANPEPKNSRPFKAKTIDTLYRGMTWYWSKGGCFYRENGELEAIWDGCLGFGRWSVDENGTLLNNVCWLMMNEDGVDSVKHQEYWRHVLDDSGTLWQHDYEEGWYAFDPGELVPGNRIDIEIARMREAFGWGPVNVDELLRASDTPSVGWKYQRILRAQIL